MSGGCRCRPGWFRPEPAVSLVQLRSARRGEGQLQTSHDTLVVRLCALALPTGDVLRVRKHMYVRNVGDGAMAVTARVAPQPDGAAALWHVLRGACGAGCAGAAAAERDVTAALQLPPHSAVQVTVEVSVRADDVWPAPAAEGLERSSATEPPGAALGVLGEARGAGGAAGDAGAVSLGGASVTAARPGYDDTCTYSGELLFHDDYNVLKAVPLLLQLELPVLRVTPDHFDFGYVCDADTRKTYFTVTHSSRTETLTVWLQWSGCEDFKLRPSRLVIPPGGAKRVYLMYNARWTGAVAEGALSAAAGGAAGAWCRAAAAVRARASRDFKCHLAPHDHTDEPSLLPDILHS
ncbi:uncharacterized protein LOC126381092 [Pectinophora gossypiella]|uniref:uncharacterized protein LOC126381092 n=1 Tax=Pectinophora gossypiella TaxID=13191 RepID=UPI00214EEE06|nr:uncharacterized protein LOC126381092 [Pectinophora gossypiella]